MSGRNWSVLEQQYLRQYYGNLPNRQLARTLSRSANAVQHQAQTLGLTKPRVVSHQPWSEKELRILEQHYERIGANAMAKRLHRSVTSVKKKAAALGLNSYTGDYIFRKTLANAFQCDDRVVKRWIEQYHLPAKPLKRGKLTMYQIYVQDFWTWAKAHKDLIPFQKYEPYSLLPEPEWLTDVSYPHRNHRKRISAYEKTTVIRMHKKGASFAEIAKQLQRTEESVKHIWRDNMK